MPNFDSVPSRESTTQGISLGAVKLNGRLTDSKYEIEPGDLSRHAFVAGVTGAGKTNTIFSILRQTSEMGKPFLIIEPAKTEYRALLNDPNLGKHLRVFTLGNEIVSPIRLNPFEIVGWPKTPVSVHLDLLRSVFAASFGMWTPLPQVLEQCLHRVYQDRGWDTTRNCNHRLDKSSDPADAYPTLSELASKVDQVIRELGYEAKISDDMRAALLTRLNGLRTGGKGRMLDVQHSLPMDSLLNNCVVLELESMGDDDDKAFLMGLIFIRLVEYRRSKGSVRNLEHLLVIEEAHRLLTNSGPRGREEEADPRGKAVETFANLLAEIRTYGQGIIVADQVPVKLAPEVIKNTNLKIVHRLVAQDDRTVLAGAMAMNEHQASSLATFKIGEAAVFAEGDDAPLLVKVPKEKDNDAWPDNDRVLGQMKSFKVPGSDCACHERSLAADRACDEARMISEKFACRRIFARLILSTLEAPESVDQMWADVISTVQTSRHSATEQHMALRCLCFHASEGFVRRRGAQANWTYAHSKGIHELLVDLLWSKAEGRSLEPSRSRLRSEMLRSCHRIADPFPSCSRICRQEPALCLYRDYAADLVESGEIAVPWREADSNDLKSEDGRRRQTWKVSQDAAYLMIQWPEDEWPLEKKQAATEVARRASLCFAQQMLYSDPRKLPRTAKRTMDRLLSEAQNG